MHLIKKDVLKIGAGLLNSISVCGNELYFVSADNNMLAKYNLNNKEIHVIAEGCGYSKYKYREPVFVFTTMENELQILVCDWHNHRVIKYRNDDYVTETGFFQARHCSKSKAILSFIKNMGYPGRYIKSHFGSEEKAILKKTSYFYNLLYFIYSSCYLGKKRFLKVNKPNGVCVYGSGYAFTQKNSSQITLLDRSLNFIKNITLEKGRLGNISNNNGRTLFCIEDESKICELSNDGNIKDLAIIQDSTVRPFSAVYLGNNLIAFIAGSFLYIVKENEKVELVKVDLEGELHGLTLKESELFVADRLNSKIHIYEVKHD